LYYSYCTELTAHYRRCTQSCSIYPSTRLQTLFLGQDRGRVPPSTGHTLHGRKQHPRRKLLVEEIPGPEAHRAYSQRLSSYWSPTEHYLNVCHPIFTHPRQELLVGETPGPEAHSPAGNNQGPLSVSCADAREPPSQLQEALKKSTKVIRRIRLAHMRT
jgi:hypothetical protein